MRVVCLSLALTLSAPAALAAEPTFLEALAARGPQEMRVTEDLIPLAGARARVSVEQGTLVIEIRRGKDGPPEAFRYDPKASVDRTNLWSEPFAELDFNALCRGDGKADYFEIACYSRAALRSRALRPPHTIWKLWLSADGLRVAQQNKGSRTSLTPLNATPKGDHGLAPGLAANLGNALGQLAAHEKGGLGGGSSGGGDWYASDLWLREVRGLDFKLERTVWPDRGGRSDQVPVTWSFDYQGPERKNPSALSWLMVRTRKGARATDFWCVGRPVAMVVVISCHKGGRPSDVKGEPDVAVRLAPFPKWKIYVEDGADNPFSSVGTSRLEPLPFP